MNAEVVYNRCRSAVCHAGQIGFYQVGSPSLGPAASQEEIERAAVSWDTFKTAKLAELKVRRRVYLWYCKEILSQWS